MIGAGALRTWGIAVSAALMAAAIAVSLQPAPAVQAPPQAAVQIEQSESTPVAFLVRFRGGGPIARAQARAQRGDAQAARRAIELQVQRQRAFVGLCFDRFTAEAVVLRTCEFVGAPEQARVQQNWLMRLRAMPAVAYAEVSASAAPSRAD